MTAAALIGQTLGGYSIEALLGSGGMASVYRGLDLHLQRPVAIKILADHTAALPGFTERFRQEARLVANLRHPNIVQIFAFGEERGLTYMVQELLPGPTLEQHMAEAARRGAPLPPAEVQHIVAQLAAALDAAHAAGVIHRDVKPANALWNAAGHLVLTDFGIAKALGGAASQTQTGVVMGTPTYMAPEQAQGQPLTAATDGYALGVILYELLVGRVPFAAPDPLAVLLQHIHNPPQPPRALRPDLPPAVEAVALRALAKDPGARYASAGALAEALRQAWSTPVHQLPTRRWAPPQATAPTPAPAPAAPATGPTVATPLPMAPPVPAAATPAPHEAPRPQAPPAPGARPSRLLPTLGALLLLAFLGAALLAFGGAPRSADQTPGDSAAATAPAAEVRALLAAAARDGSAGPRGAELVATLDAAQQALDRGDRAEATTQLAILQRVLVQEARAGALAPELLRRGLFGIDAIAAEHRLTLPLSVDTG